MVATRSAPILRATKLTKRYGQRTALIDASFELWSGEVLAIVGESGSGKSTLLNVLAARDRPDAGTVEFQLKGGIKIRPMACVWTFLRVRMLESA